MMIDGQPVAKAIDFGVAKTTAGNRSDESMSTHLGAVVGPQEYMSWEHLGVSGEVIVTRADTYSVGVILHGLLTGLRLLDAQHLKQAARTEKIHNIPEEAS